VKVRFEPRGHVSTRRRPRRWRFLSVARHVPSSRSRIRFGGATTIPLTVAKSTNVL
jgi:hypothetical protein